MTTYDYTREIAKDLRINGKLLATRVRDQVIDGSLSLSVRRAPALEFTVRDTFDLALTRDALRLFNEGTTVGWQNHTFTVETFTTGGGTEYPTVTVTATSQMIYELDDERGAHSWDRREVSSWAKEIFRSAGSVPVVQEELGERPLERKADDEIPENGETTWDVVADAAKQVGAWVFDNGERLVMGKPTWLAKRPEAHRVAITWNSWTDHTDALVEAPQYTWDHDAKAWEGREELTLSVMQAPSDPDAGLMRLRPGDLLTWEGAGNPTDNNEWIVVEVDRPLTTGLPVSITCWRVIDPPVIAESTSSGDGEYGAAVPTGPLGEMGWNGEQLANAAEIVKEGQRRKHPKLAWVLAVMCAMGESSLIIKDHGDTAGPDSRGLFQQRDSWGSLADRMNAAKSAGLFYNVLMDQDYGGVKTAVAASYVIHLVQRNADPNHYTRFWGDAQIVVDACVEAGERAPEVSKEEAPRATGQLGTRINSLMRSYEMQSIDVDNFGYMGNLFQCYDLAQKYLTDLTGIGMIRGDGYMWWKHSALMTKFTAIPPDQPPRRGDIASWRMGALDSSVGHVAIFSHIHKGTFFFLSQNPGPSKTQPLPTEGLQGWMRPKDLR